MKLAMVPLSRLNPECPDQYHPEKQCWVRQPEIFEILGRIPFLAIDRLSSFLEASKKLGYVREDVDTDLAALIFFSFMFRSLVAKAFIGKDVFIEMSEETIRGLADITVNGIGGGD